MSNTAIQQAIEESMDDIKARDDALMMEVVGVTQAIDHLRKALDQVEACLDTRDFFKASSLGYNDVATEFIFLQRTLGALQYQADAKSELVTDIAVRSGVGVYEEVAPFVDDVMQSTKALTPEQKRKNKKAAKKLAKTLSKERTRE